jgi:fructose/tagatose bisphosphate aldolase
MYEKEFEALTNLVENSLAVKDSVVSVTDAKKFRANVDKLVEVSALGSGMKQMLARYLVRAAALDMGVVPASIHDLYIARGAGKVPNDFTVPAINLRVLSFEAARAVFKVADKMNAGAFIFEIARSEIGYTNQRPSEYMTNMLAAAIKEGFTGPVFVQGDHFQISASRYQNDPDSELQAVKDLTVEAIEAGFFNIDVDTSTLVDLSKVTVPEQQALNTQLSAQLTAFIRGLEPDGVTISVGGEIGEVGGRNSNEEELRAYTDGFNADLKKFGEDLVGLSKISIQTGTSHGGVVLPDGTIAEVSVDFDTLLQLSRVAREYGMAGAVQHGASTLPQDAFGKFVEAEACEVHLATNFQNIFYDHAPEDLKSEIYAYLEKNHANERKEGMTEDQFYYTSRKRAIGPFKKQIMALPQAKKDEICQAWQAQFDQLFTLLNLKDTTKYVDEFVKAVKVTPDLQVYTKMAKAEIAEEDTSDLAD